MATLIAGRVTTILDADNKRFKQKVGETQKDLGKLGKSGQKSGAMISSGMKAAALGGVAILSAAFLKLTKDSIKLAGAFEQIEVSFNVMVGDADQANLLISKIQELGAATPFTTTKLLEASKALLAFGFNSKEIVPTLRILGDVSAGTGKDIKEMAIIFGQIKSAGRLMGQDLLQLINAGFNPLQQISEKTGRSMIQLKKDMSNGLITFDMVKQSFIDATSEGGKFQDLMIKISETLPGKISTLSSNWDEFRKNFGKPFVNPLKDILDDINETLASLNTANANLEKARKARELEGKEGTGVIEGEGTAVTVVKNAFALLKLGFNQINSDINKATKALGFPDANPRGIIDDLEKVGQRLHDNIFGVFFGLEAPTESEKHLDRKRNKARKEELDRQIAEADARINPDISFIPEFREVGVSDDIIKFVEQMTEAEIDKSLLNFFDELDKWGDKISELENLWDGLDFEDDLQRQAERVRELAEEDRKELEREANRNADNLSGAFARGTVEAQRIIQQSGNKKPEEKTAKNTEEIARLMSNLLLNGVKLQDVGLAQANDL